MQRSGRRLHLGQIRPDSPQHEIGPGLQAGHAVGVGRDAVPGPCFARGLEGVAVIVEPVQGEDHRLDWAIWQPFAERQHLSVGGDKARSGKTRHRVRLGCRTRGADAGEPRVFVGRRSATHRQQQCGSHPTSTKAGSCPSPAAHAFLSVPQARICFLEGIVDC